MITRKILEEIAISSNRRIDSEALEKTVCTQEDASLRSPGVAAHYYRFFYRLAQEIKPELTVELGTHTGISSACLAEGHPEGSVITIDNMPQVEKECIRQNIEYRIHDSLQEYVPPKKIDILFIDTDHDGVRCQKEYDLYLKHMKEHGVIFFDDIRLFGCMQEFWKKFDPGPAHKFELNVHGKAGFGVVIL